MVRHLSMSRRLLISAQKVWRAFSILETSRALQRFQLSANMRTCYGAQGDGDMNQNTSFGTGLSLEKTTLETKQLDPAKTTAFDTRK